MTQRSLPDGERNTLAAAAARSSWSHDPNVASAADTVVFMRDGRITRVAGGMGADEIFAGMGRG